MTQSTDDPRAPVHRPAPVVLAHLVRDLVRDATRVVVPLACAGCGLADHVLCPGCAAQIDPRRLDGAAPALDGTLPVWGLGWYEGRLRAAVLAWKTAGRRDVERYLVTGLAGAARELLAQLPLSGATLVVVPAPSGPWRWLRGRPAVLRLCRTVAQAAAASAGEARVVVALGSLQRGGGRGTQRHGPRPVRSRLRLDGSAVLLVDDVLTTGATLAACRDAVLAAGGDVIGAVVLAGVRVRGRRS